ncbi:MULTISPECIES: CYTH and CHAD domain-containing protein [unclassified Dietzia]|uniref:CYTH and CHAD domain-containing protein n=1 Tax=unclassified Dietzia TaxID=2617939 RepID=UPI0015F81352|nr:MULTISPECIES: CYTH and CHAD domain-containing protein [unclassified Dietzia]MBB1025299.1 CYTH and CHAD domain-containing protein [Dietzia sp. DQ12-76]MBB1026519.1 CYTH and CHAD domain-containing protein [Dietzia sp. DQ11-38-2]
MTISETVEIESKFEVDPDTPIPAADAFAPLLADDPVVHELSATYYDTADLSLTRHKVTLRRRTGGDDSGWHLKLPSEAGRVELRLPLDHGDDVPAELVAAVAGLVRRRPLAPVARVNNRRHVMLLRDPDGAAVVEFCDDRVSTQSFATGNADGDWREWEVELVDPSRPGARGHLDTVATACTSAGATTSSSSSKLARALGPLPSPDDAGVSAVRDALREDLDKVLDHDPAARRVTMVGVHQMRVAVRGLRSTISSFAEELEAETEGTEIDLADLLDELKVLAAVLGKVRDIQVVDQRLGGLAAEYPDDVVSPLTRQRLSDELASEERRAGARVTEALGSDRYLALLDRLHLLVDVAGTGSGGRSGTDSGSGSGPRSGDTAPTSKKRRREAQDMVLRGVDRQFAKFTKARTRTERDLDSLELTLAQREELTHVVRKRAKALRRNVGALRESDGLTVAPLRTACQRLHTVLGDVQDSVTARMWIRRIARRAESAGEPTFGFGVLFEHERGFSERALAGFESDAATVTAAYRELSESRRAARRRKTTNKKKKKKKGTGT